MLQQRDVDALVVRPFQRIPTDRAEGPLGRHGRVRHVERRAVEPLLRPPRPGVRIANEKWALTRALAGVEVGVAEYRRERAVRLQGHDRRHRPAARKSIDQALLIEEFATLA